ncbi:deoxyribose-phosphate aldolase [Jeotgalibaca caeni]|uniref:deoxyribose-phosphate aldolase n=1 Tax=Jeotgalibaca caeni TaxID=3028623 RepID=UPI00237ED6B7|nr:deoxyribose-phosphate aldolase [Jeotgalibaca caeni]MDE1549823.1 deoxyribose-phosphate aldolase [Jeotgalibaca caeni]
MTDKNLAQYFDHTILSPDARRADVKRVCDEAKEYKTATVCVNGHWIPFVKEQLEGTSVKPIAVIGFPLGAGTTASKVFEAENAIDLGAEEIDMVINIGEMLDGNLEFVQADVKAVVDAVHAKGKLLKVIIETAYLTEEQIVTVSKLSKEAGTDFVKTSTGFAHAGATIENVKLMREAVGENVGVKASGGIRTAEDVDAMMTAGANRVGLSRTVEIMNS